MVINNKYRYLIYFRPDLSQYYHAAVYQVYDQKKSKNHIQFAPFLSVSLYICCTISLRLDSIFLLAAMSVDGLPILYEPPSSYSERILQLFLEPVGPSFQHVQFISFSFEHWSHLLANLVWGVGAVSGVFISSSRLIFGVEWCETCGM